MEEKHPYYPPVVNDEAAARFVTTVASSVYGGDKVDGDTEATMAGEDFAFIAQEVPSAFIFLGIRNETAGSVHGLHTSKFSMDESALKHGAALHVHLVTRYLANGGSFVDGKGAASTGTREEL